MFYERYGIIYLLMVMVLRHIELNLFELQKSSQYYLSFMNASP